MEKGGKSPISDVFELPNPDYSAILATGRRGRAVTPSLDIREKPFERATEPREQPFNASANLRLPNTAEHHGIPSEIRTNSPAISPCARVPQRGRLCVRYQTSVYCLQSANPMPTQLIHIIHATIHPVCSRPNGEAPIRSTKCRVSCPGTLTCGAVVTEYTVSLRRRVPAPAINQIGAQLRGRQ